MTTLVGVDRYTGLPIAGIDHLKQSITDILTTPVGSRVMRPEYGSNLPRMVDLPVNKGWISAAQAEIARSLNRWEPRLKLSRAKVVSVIDGQINLMITGEYQGDDLLLEVLV